MIGKERRRKQRRRVLAEVSVRCEDTGDVLGTLVDLTREGLMLVGGRRIVPGRLFRLELLLPAAIEGNDRIELSARSLWTCRQPASTQRLTGFGDLAIDAANRTLLDHLLAAYGTGDLPFSAGDVIDLSPAGR